MKRSIQKGTRHLFFVLVLFLLNSCATSPGVKVIYHLPEATDDLIGKEVFLSVEDVRKDKRFLGEGAKKEFKLFTGDVYLYFTETSAAPLNMGLHDVVSLFKEVFTKRLEHMGIRVEKVKGRVETEISIVLKEFTLDLADRNWVVKLRYDAVLLKRGKEMTRQPIILSILVQREAMKGVIL